MTKKMTLLALAVACTAVFAMPSVASAGSWKLDRGAVDQSFTVAGGPGQLTAETVPGESTLTVKCTSTTGEGAYTTDTSGELELEFHGCTGPLGVSCASPGEPAGTIIADVYIHNVFLSPDRTTPGVTITGPGNSTSATMSTFSCFGIETTVSGSTNGHLEAKCLETPRTVVHPEFASTATHGTSKWRYVTGNEKTTPDDLTVNTSGTHRRGSFDATVSVIFREASTITCGTE